MTGGAPGDSTHVLATLAYRYTSPWAGSSGAWPPSRWRCRRRWLHRHAAAVGEDMNRARHSRSLQIWLSVIAVVMLIWTLFPVYHMLLLSSRRPTISSSRASTSSTPRSGTTCTRWAGQPVRALLLAPDRQQPRDRRVAMVVVAAIAALGSFAMARINFRFRRWVSGLTLFTT